MSNNEKINVIIDNREVKLIEYFTKNIDKKK